ncbi:MAG: putative quinol monooxygenase [Thermoanaerobaculia bacterium]
MFARVSNGVAREGMLEELVRLANESLAPTALEQEGCRGMLLLTHAGSGRVIAISLWDTEEALLTSESGDYMRQMVARVADYLEEAGPSQQSFRVSGSWLRSAASREGR